MPNSVTLLSPEVISLVAAQQVVDRPLTVVKELVENALDAGTSSIRIALKEGGFTQISVQDTGGGMSADDLHLAVDRHTTSKIHTIQDVEFVTTLGFRGEGLWSIGQVARLEIRTAQKSNSIGSSLLMAHGKILSEEPVGSPLGTWIKVSELFWHTPGRKKRQKSPVAELRAITQLCTQYAWLFPQVSWSVEHNGLPITTYPAVDTLLERAFQIWGNTITTYAVPLELEADWGKVSGLLVLPQEARTHTKQQYLGINHRPVALPSLSNMIRSEYTRFLAPERHPLWVIRCQCIPGWVDANVHPRKEQVAVHDETIFLSSLQTAVRKLLTTQDKTHIHTTSRRQHAFDPAVKELLALETTFDPREKSEDKEILQIDRTYLAVSSPQGLLLIDQHAAHESELYNQLKLAWETQEKKAISQVDNILVHLTPQEGLVLQENRALLEKLGIFVHFISPSELTVQFLPSSWARWPLEQLFSDLAFQLETGQSSEQGLPWIHTTLAYLACKRAIKAGDYLAQSERANLVNHVLQTPDTYTCPHGRPTRILIPTKKLAQWFERE